jgi:redox-sensitive bicupin YhaK (pirin superfamily)
MEEIMITIRRSEERGQTAVDWLDSRHSFSFGDYYDSAHMGFGALRVINDDRVAPESGFGAHPHRDMEILSYVLDGALEHRDSLGNGSEITAGEVQRMTAGTGIRHSEYNGSPVEPVHLLQIWILPEKRGLVPDYEQRRFSPEEKRGQLRLIASRDGRDGSVTIHQDVDVYAGVLEPGDRVSHVLRPGRRAWVQLARGEVRLGDQLLRAGDGAAIQDEAAVELAAVKGAELLVFDLA